MTIEPATPEQSYVITGTGPYPINWPYAIGGLSAWAILSGVRTDLVADVDFTLSPVSSATTGNLTLSAGAGVLYAGGMLYMGRATVPQQGWLGTLGVREKGLEAQLDLMVMKLQELTLAVSRTLRLDRLMKPFVPVADRVVIIDQNLQPALGPSVAEIAAAGTHAADAVAAAEAAEESAGKALAAENSLLEWKRAWTTATAYAPSDIVHEAGSAYICIAAHTSGATFAADKTAGKWDDFALKGAAGAGAGDVIAANKGSEYVPNAHDFRATLALALSAYTPLAAVDLFTWTGGSGGLMNAGAGLTNMPPGGAAGDRFSYKSQDDDNKFFCWFFKDGRIAVNHKNAAVWSGWTFIPTMAELIAAIAATTQVLHVGDRRASGTSAGTSTAGSYLTRVLNAILTNTISGASLAANQITLPAGTYEIDARVPGYACGGFRAKLFNVTDGADLIIGGFGSASVSYLTADYCTVRGRFTLAATKALDVRMRCNVTRATDGLGVPLGYGDVESYTDVFIRKIS